MAVRMRRPSCRHADQLVAVRFGTANCSRCDLRLPALVMSERVGMSPDGNTPEVRTFIRRAELLRVRLIQGVEGPLGKIDVSQLRLGDVLTLRREEGESLIAKGWAVAL